MPFDKTLAKRLANACMWVYELANQSFENSADNALQLAATDKEGTLVNEQGKLPTITRIRDLAPIHTSYAGVLEYDDLVILAFQGTITEFKRRDFRLDSPVDWLENFKALLLPEATTGLPGGVHKGFFHQLDLIYDQIERLPALKSGKTLYVTGHSQGGAIAALATKRLELSGIPVKATYTFEAPRPGNGEFAASVAPVVFRFEYGDDIVPHVPPVPPSLPGWDWLDTVNGAMSSLEAFFDECDAVVSGVVEVIKNLSPTAPKKPRVEGDSDRHILGKIMRDFKELIDWSEGCKYRSVGTLTYATESEFREDLSEEQEQRVLLERIGRLCTAKQALVHDHHVDTFFHLFD